MTTYANVGHILLKRGNTAQSLAYTGPVGELTLDTGLFAVRVHDGVTPGGNIILDNESQISANVAALSANLGAFQTYANTTFSTGGGSTYGNANVAAYLPVNPTILSIQANLGTATTNITTLTANAASQALSINTLQTNAGVQSDAISLLQANAASQATSINTISANLGAFQTYANATFTVSSYGNANVAVYLPTDSTITGIKSDISTLQANAGIQAALLDSLSGNAVTVSQELLDLTANAAAQSVELTQLMSNAAVQATELDTLMANAAAQATELNVLISNAALQSTAIDSLQANAGVQATAIDNLQSNAAIQSLALDAIGGNLSSFKIYANATFGTSSYGNANVAAYLPTYTGNIFARIVSGNLRTVKSAPLTSFGNVGDTRGDIAIDSNYVYICTANFIPESYSFSSTFDGIDQGPTNYYDVLSSEPDWPAYIENGWIISGPGVTGGTATITNIVSPYNGFKTRVTFDEAITWNLGAAYTVTDPTYMANLVIWKSAPLTSFQTPAYGNAAVQTYLENIVGNVLPAANVTYSLGSESMQWKDLWVSNNTIYIGNTPIRVDGGTLLVNNAPVGGGVTGNIAVDTSAIQFVANSSGDGNGYSTMRLIPDTNQEGTDQYLIVDPTAPGHIHIRAGGEQDSSSADLILGGENSHVRLTAGPNPPVYIRVNSANWTFGVDSSLSMPTGGNLYFDSSAVSVIDGFSSLRFATNSVSIGSTSGFATGQGYNAVALGVSAGQYSQGTAAIAVGRLAGNSSQGGYAVAIGSTAGTNSQGSAAVAIGDSAGEITQSSDAVAIGATAGNYQQGASAVAVGYAAGTQVQGQDAVAVGTSAGQGIIRTATYVSGGVSDTTLVMTIDFDLTVYVGMVITGTGFTSGQRITAIVNSTTYTISAQADSTPSGQLTLVGGQGTSAVAVGLQSGKIAQGSYGIAVGYKAGETSQGQSGIAIGYEAGAARQKNNAIAIGTTSGRVDQFESAIAIGVNAGFSNQGFGAIAIGDGAASQFQKSGAIAIGYSAGGALQGNNAIALGFGAQAGGAIAQPNNSIVINATGSVLDNAVADSFVIAPVRNVSSADGILQYNNTTKEVSYSSTVGGNLTVNVNVTAGNLITTNGVFWSNGAVYSTGGSSYGNTEVAAYLLTYTGNILADSIAANFANLSSLQVNGTTRLGNVIINSRLPNYEAVIAYADVNHNMLIEGGNNLKVAANGNLELSPGNGNTVLFSAGMIPGKVQFDVPVKSTNVTNSTSTSTGALTVAGGIGVAGNVHVGENAIAGNLITTNGVFWSNGSVYSTGGGGTDDILRANVGAYQTWANITIQTIDANLGAFQTYANATFGTSSYGNTQATALLRTFGSNSISTTGNITGNVTQVYQGVDNTNSTYRILLSTSGSAGARTPVFATTMSANPAIGLLTVANLSVTAGGSIGTLVATNLSTANAQISGGTSVFTNLSTANAVITGGYATGLANVAVTGDATAGGNVTVSGNVTAGNLIGYGANTSVVAGAYTTQFLTNGAVVTDSVVVMPARPAFRVYGGEPAWYDTANINLKGSSIVVDYNQGNWFNSTTGVFTAPVTGLYQTTLNARVGSNNGVNQILVIKNGLNTPGNALMMWETDTNSNTAVHFGVSTVVKLNAGDFLTANITAGNIQFDQNDSWTVTYIG